MKLREIEISNFIGARDISIGVDAPVLVVGGDNEAGKSSIREAIALAITGEMTRVKLKKDYGDVVSDGAKSGKIVVRTTAGSASFEVPTGRWGDNIDYDGVLMPAAMRYVIDPSKFAELDQAGRRKFMFALDGTNIGASEIGRRLGTRDVGAAVVDAVLPVLREGGFDGAAKHAAGQARELKGSWREVTGETWGAQKADAWIAPAGDFDEAAATRHDAKLQSARAELDEARAKHLEIKARYDSASRTRAAISDARDGIKRRKEIAAEVGRLEANAGSLRTQLKVATEELNTATAAVDAARRAAGGGRASAAGPDDAGHDVPDQLAVEAVGVLAELHDLVNESSGVDFGDGTATKAWGEFDFVARGIDIAVAFGARYPDYARPDHVVDAPAADAGPAEIDHDLISTQVAASSRVAEIDLELANAEQLASNMAAKLKDIDSRAAALADLESQLDDVSPADLETADARATAAKNAVAVLEASMRQHEQARAAMLDAKRKTKRAGDLHADILSWTACAKALGPDGIPAEIVAEAMAPINDKLREIASLSGWPQVEIDSEMTIRYGARRYELCAESGRWRADACIAATIAALSGIRFVMLDRVDINSLPNRAKLMRWLAGSVKAGILDGAVVLGTFKAPPVGLPPDYFESVWVESGRIAVPEIARAAAA